MVSIETPQNVEYNTNDLMSMINNIISYFIF